MKRIGACIVTGAAAALLPCTVCAAAFQPTATGDDTPVELLTVVLVAALVVLAAVTLLRVFFSRRRTAALRKNAFPQEREKAPLRTEEEIADGTDEPSKKKKAP